MKNASLIFAILILFSYNSLLSQIQTVSPNIERYLISGTVTDSSSGEPILFGAVALYEGDKLLQGTETDLDGNYFFYIDKLGVYDLVVTYFGYQPTRITGVNLNSAEAMIVDIAIQEGVSLTTATIVCYREPLINYDNTYSGGTVTAEQIISLPTRNSTAVSAIIDGVKVTGNKRNNRNNRKSKEPAFNTEEYNLILENKFHNTKVEALSTFSIDVDRASYSNVRRFINQDQMPPKDAVRVEEMINYFPYNYAEPIDGVPFNIEHNLTNCPWNSKNQILHIGIQGEKIEKTELPTSNLVFLVDVSGSMNCDNKLALVKSSLFLLVDNLREEDKIALVVYAGSAGMVLNATSGIEKSVIKEAIHNLSAGGSTAGGAGIDLAYKVAQENFIKNGNNRVILATDGDFNVGASNEGGLVRLIEKKREQDIFLSVLGFGMGNYKDNKMQQLADSGNGNHAYIDNLAEAKKTLIDEFGGTLFTIAKDVKIQIEFNPEFVKEYKLIGYENRILDKQDFNDDKKDAGDLGAGHSVTAFYEIVPTRIRRNKSVAVDELKYQKMSSTENQTDLATIKLRYKEPTGTRSKKIERIITPSLNEQVSDEVQFALCVAEFGMLLRKSNAVKNSTYIDLLQKTSSFIEIDKQGYRGEFLGLIENVIAIKSDFED